MGRTYNTFKYFLFFLFLLCSFHDDAFGMSSNSTWRQITPEELAKFKNKDSYKEYLKEIIRCRRREETREATVDDIEINEEGLFRWRIPTAIAQTSNNHAAVDKNEAIIAARTLLNGAIEAHHKTKVSKRGHKGKVIELEQENQQLRVRILELQKGLHDEDALRSLRNQMDRLRYTHRREVEELTKAIEDLRAEKRDEIRLLTASVEEFKTHFRNKFKDYGIREEDIFEGRDVNPEVLRGTAGKVARSTVVAANPFIDLVESICDNLDFRLNETEKQNKLLLAEIASTNEHLARQLEENRRLAQERDKWEFLAEQRLAQLHIAEQQLEQTNKEMEIKWTKAMEEQQKLILHLQKANSRLAKAEQELSEGLSVLDAGRQGAQAMASTAASAPALEKGKVRKLNKAIKELKEKFELEHLTNVSMRQQILGHVQALEALTKERDAQLVLLAQQGEIIAELQTTIASLEEDLDKFTTSNQKLREALGGVQELMGESARFEASGSESIVEKLKRQLEEYKRSAAEREDRLRMLDAQNAEYHEELDKWNAEFEGTKTYMQRQIDGHIAELEREIAELREMVQDQQQIIQGQEEAVLGAAEMNEELADYNEELLVQIRMLEEEKIQLQLFNRRLQEEQAEQSITDLNSAISESAMVLGSVIDDSAVIAEPAEEDLEQQRSVMEERTQALKEKEAFMREQQRDLAEQSRLNEDIARRLEEEERALLISQEEQKVRARELATRERKVRELKVKLEGAAVTFPYQQREIESDEENLGREKELLTNQIAALRCRLNILEGHEDGEGGSTSTSTVLYNISSPELISNRRRFVHQRTSSSHGDEGALSFGGASTNTTSTASLVLAIADDEPPQVRGHSTSANNRLNLEE